MTFDVQITRHAVQRMVERLPGRGDADDHQAWAHEQVVDALCRGGLTRKPPRWAALGTRPVSDNHRYVRASRSEVDVILAVVVEPDRKRVVVTTVVASSTRDKHFRGTRANARAKAWSRKNRLRTKQHPREEPPA